MINGQALVIIYYVLLILILLLMLYVNLIDHNHLQMMIRLNHHDLDQLNQS